VVEFSEAYNRLGIVNPDKQKFATTVLNETCYELIRRTEELIALADGHRESAESWADLLRSCKRHGMRAPVLAIGDGALGFWKAIREVFPDTEEQRCWFVSREAVGTLRPR